MMLYFRMITGKPVLNIIGVGLLFCLLITPATAWAETETVKIFLMAGQSNMQGNNALVSRLEKLLCHAGEIDMDGETCGSSAIDPSELDDRFKDTVLADYNDAVSAGLSANVTETLRCFLCRTGEISDQCGPCSNESFTLTDRFFRTISSYYDTGSAYGYGYDAFKHMTTAMGLSEIHADGMFASRLLENREDVSVLLFTGRHQSDGALSLTKKKGALSTGFGVNSNQYGPELLFGHYMGEFVDNDILILKVVQGGTSLRVEWRSPGVEANTENQYTDADLKKASLYDVLIEKALSLTEGSTLGTEFPEYAGKTAEIAGFVWFQGWNDGCNDVAAQNYEINFTRFIEDLRTDLSLPGLPVVVAQSHHGDSTGPVQTAQANVAAGTDFMEMCVTDDLSNYYHFDPASHPVIGMRMAKTMKTLIVQEPPNTAPEAFSAVVDVPYETSVTILLGGADKDGDPISFIVTKGPEHGTLTGTAPNLTYTPEPVYSGPDEFTFMTSDGIDGSNPATIGLTVAARQETPDEKPAGQNSSHSVNTNTGLMIHLSATDPAGRDLTYAVVRDPEHGTLNGSPPDLLYQPDQNYTGKDSFAYTVSNGIMESDPATVSITVRSAAILSDKEEEGCFIHTLF